LDIKKQKGLLEDFLPKAFAIVREASKRVLDMRHFDVQLIGGMVLHECQIAEMKTGEGKTLVATLPCYLNALTGKGVHVVTVNDYLARRDAEWMGQVHRFLGLSVGLIQQDMSPVERKKNYACDITYATNSELGFDYLRDNMSTDINEVVQRKFNYCVIDEVDSILIDEARTPLIISGQVERPQEKYNKASELALSIPKAKELRRVAEPLITLAKEDSLMRRRLAYSRIQDKKAVKKLFEVLGPRFKNRPGGYMRILKHGFKKGDASPKAYVELTEKS